MSAEGTLSLVVATLGVLDKDGDIIAHGSVGEQECLLSQFQHSIWNGAIPIGRGKVYEDGDLLKWDGNFFMQLADACNTWQAIAAAKDLLEVSFGFSVLRRSWVDPPTGGGFSVRQLDELKVWECSPVVAGAGIGTGIEAIKSLTLPTLAPEDNPDTEPLLSPDAIIAMDTLKRIGGYDA